MIPVYQVYFVGFKNGQRYAGEIRGPYTYGDTFQHKEVCEALRYDHDEIIRVRMRGTHNWLADQASAKDHAERLWQKD